MNLSKGRLVPKEPVEMLLMCLVHNCSLKLPPSQPAAEGGTVLTTLLRGSSSAT